MRNRQPGPPRLCIFRNGLAAAFLLCGLSGLAAMPVRADPVADFYKGKDLRLIISSTVGGGYDVYARTIARHLGRHIPGNPAIVPQNMPGAGGIAAANHIYAVAPKDGSVIAAIQNTVPFEPFFDKKAALFDAARLAWLGTPTTEVGMYIVWHASKIKTLRDAQTEVMIAGGAGAASTPAFYGRIFNQILHLKARLVTGYPGQNEILLAMENGEVEAMPSPFWSSLKVQRPRWYPESIIRRPRRRSRSGVPTRHRRACRPTGSQRCARRCSRPSRTRSSSPTASANAWNAPITGLGPNSKA